MYKLVSKQKAYSSKISIFYSPFSNRKKSSIWELFFAFTVCRENTYISRLLAIIFIHITESIIFITNFIIQKIKTVHSHHMWCYSKSIVSEGLSAQKKTPIRLLKTKILPIWEFFFRFENGLGKILIFEE